ncbi:MAG TPA: hypothetical protein VHN20_08005 [Beijerinckiaceae bacterium]|nr:hypothetical protein [Beijerinckiaceae bacterium]
MTTMERGRWTAPRAQTVDVFVGDVVAPADRAFFASDFLMATAARPPIDATLPATSTAAVTHMGHMAFSLSPVL